MRPRESSPAHVARTVEIGTKLAVRRPKPLIPLNTALDNVSNSSNTSLSLIPAVLMLTRIASARIGDRITSITADARFLVVFDFIRFVCSPVDCDAMLLRDEHDNYNRCAIGPVLSLWGFCGPVVACG